MNKTLAELEGKWHHEIPDENYSSSIQLRSYRLYYVRLTEYTIDDIRFMIGQQMGMNFLVPKAMEYLHKDLLIEASYYEGDLLQGLLTVPSSFWLQNPELSGSLCDILLTNRIQLDKLDMQFEADRKLLMAYGNYIELVCKLRHHIIVDS